MDFKFFSKNGDISPMEEATMPLSNVEYQYGFGVYETIRVVHSVPLFLEEHLARLETSARIIGLEHTFTDTFIYESARELVKQNEVGTCNLKILLIGPSTSQRAGGQASLFILCLNPLFPEKKLYRDGVHCVTYEYERLFPHAKTLNMLGSYLAYKKAKEYAAYDALLVNREGYLTEGTRTNLFVIRGRTIVSPPENEILLGVTRAHVLKVAQANGYAFQSARFSLADLPRYDGVFLTSTSSKIMPITSVDETTLPDIPESLRELMDLFDAYLAEEQSAPSRQR